MMGSTADTDPDRWHDEVQRRVHVAQPFYLSQTEVTQEQFHSVLGENPSGFCAPRHPVEMVDLVDCLRYCNELSRLEGLEPCYFLEGSAIALRTGLPLARAGYRLPTEEEWEYGARANQAYRFAGSNEAKHVAWYADNAAASTRPVAEKQPNAWQLFDMSGNVFEWVFSVYQACWDAHSALALDHGIAREYVVRGGAWSSAADMLRVSHRLSVPATWRTNYIGFRIARTMPS